VVLQDGSRRHYLQHPEVTLGASGIWTASNVRPDHGITKILFLQLGRYGKKHFDAMVVNESWEAFDSLPPNCLLLASVAIDRL
jgi:hypothetical protein